MKTILVLVVILIFTILSIFIGKLLKLKKIGPSARFRIIKREYCGDTLFYIQQYYGASGWTYMSGSLYYSSQEKAIEELNKLLTPPPQPVDTVVYEKY
jgi:hypothetical protein